MTNKYPHTEPAPNQHPASSEITQASLLNPPARPQIEEKMTYLIGSAGRRSALETQEYSGKPNWDLKDFTDTSDGIHYVPMNSCASVELGWWDTGFLVTGNLNGCLAIGAAYRDEQKSVHAFLEHYDDEYVRTVGENGRLKVSELLDEFAGEQPVKVVVAYSKDHNPLRDDKETYYPDHFPVEAILRGSQDLPDGSSVLFIPYKTSDQHNDPTTGHMLHVGKGGSGLISFGWNGHTVEVGEPESFDDKHRNAAREILSVMDAAAESMNAADGFSPRDK